MRGDILDSVVRVQVLVQRDLEHRGTSLSRSDDGRSEEVEPDLVDETHDDESVSGVRVGAREKERGRQENAYSVPTFTVLGENLVLVHDPVLVPTVKSSRVCYEKPSSLSVFRSCPGTQITTGLGKVRGRFRVRHTVYTENINVRDFEPGLLETTDNPVESARSVSSRENVLVHEQSPAKKRRDFPRVRLTDKGDESEVRLTYQMRSSNCHEGRIPATWKTRIPSSSSKL